MAYYEVINITLGSLRRQHRSKLIDSPTIYHSIPKEVTLGVQE